MSEVGREFDPSGSSDDDMARLNALRDLKILDTDPDPAFDNLTRVAAATFEAPIAFVSLVDEHRQWFKSKYGSDASETSIESSFCAHAIREHGVMVVLNATEDTRFRDYPNVVGDPHIRFYAGAPISTKEGQNVGTLCVIDTKPRERFTWYQAEILQRMAQLVSREMQAHSVKSSGHNECASKRSLPDLPGAA
jgi:GAF domain-containing protein